MGMTLRNLMASVLLLAASLTDPALAQVAGGAACDSRTSGEPCRLSWNLTSTPRAFYWVQQLDPESGAWRSLDSPETATVVRGIRSEPVAAGYLYRVFACNDRGGREDCVSSTVHWVPVMLFNLLIQGLSRARID
jgi:hypothetical protein